MMMMMITDEDIKKVQRLGRRVVAQTAPRPILLQFASRGAKNLVMESLYTLKSTEAKYRSTEIQKE